MNTLMHRAVKLLQLPSLDFKLEVERIATLNPFLSLMMPDTQLDAEATLPHSGEAQWCADASATAGQSARSTAESIEGGDTNLLGTFGFADVFPDPAPFPGGHGESSRESVLACPGRMDVREHLLEQVPDLRLPNRERDLVLCVIHSLDDDGYLRDAPATLAASLPESWNTSAEEIETSIRHVQSLDPCGVGARSLSEYLSLQILRRLPPSDVRSLALRICAEHLSLLGSHEYGRLAREIGVSRDRALEALSLILRLRPRIEVDHHVPGAQIVIPDVSVSLTREGIALDLNKGVIPQVRLNDEYISQVGLGRFARSDRINVCVAEARWVVRLVDQRLRTILDVSAAIARRQRQFFQLGDLALTPMTLKDIATELGIHESTVCRVTNGKYMSTPRGVMELKKFFSREIVTDSGRKCSSNAVRGLVKAMLESAGRPISDAEIAVQLATQGIRLSRRTVTKYRNALGLNPLALQRLHERSSSAR